MPCPTQTFSRVSLGLSIRVSVYAIIKVVGLCMQGPINCGVKFVLLRRKDTPKVGVGRGSPAHTDVTSGTSLIGRDRVQPPAVGTGVRGTCLVGIGPVYPVYGWGREFRYGRTKRCD